MAHTNTVSMTTYNTLYEVIQCQRYCTIRLFVHCLSLKKTRLGFFLLQIMTEQLCTQVVHKPHPDPDSTVKIQNPSEPNEC